MLKHLPSVAIVGLCTVIGGLGLWVVALRDQNHELQRRIVRLRKLREKERQESRGVPSYIAARLSQ